MSQKKPTNLPAFLTGAESNINLSVRRMTDALNTNKSYAINFFTGVEKRVSQDGNVFPALFQSKAKDVINLLPGDFINYGFWDLEDPEKYAGMQPQGQISRSRQSIITRQVALIVYGNMDKLIAKTGITNEDYRYFKQQVKDEIVHVLSTKLTLMYGMFNLTQVYEHDIKDIFKGYTVKEDDSQFMQYPMFGFRFEGELTVKEQCLAATPSTGITIGLGTSYRTEWISSDTTWLALIPAGQELLSILIENSTINAAQLSIGITPGGLEVVNGCPVREKSQLENGLTSLTIENTYSLQYSTSIYIHHAGEDDTWNGALIRLTFVWKPA